jgi:hypothetical protein
MAKLDPLLAEIEKFLKKRKISPTLFGKMALNDPRFVFQLRDGRDYRRSTEDRVRSFIRSTAGAK